MDKKKNHENLLDVSEEHTKHSKSYPALLDMP